MTGLMTLEEVASYLRVTKKTVYRLLEKDSIPAMKVGRLWRFDKDSIDGWLRNSTVSATANILVVDDDEDIRTLFKDTLDELGHKVTATSEAFQAMELIKGQEYDLVFLDLKLPGMDGAELFKRIRQIKPTLPVNIITGHADSELMTKALAHGPFGVMSKPFNSADIVAVVDNYLRFGLTSK